MTDAASTVLEQIMLWIEGRISPPSNILDVTLPDAGQKLRFRRVSIMGGRGYVVSLDDPQIRIDYDPTWENHAKVARLIQAVAPTAAS